MKFAAGFMAAAICAAMMVATPMAALAEQPNAASVPLALIAQETAGETGGDSLAEDPASESEPAPKPAPIDISAAEVKLSKPSHVYTGSAIEPKPRVVLDGATLKRDRDFTVSYKANKRIGIATVTVKGAGAYTGVASASFTITPGKAKFSSVKSTGPGQITLAAKKVAKAKSLQFQASRTRSFSKIAAKATTAKTSCTFKKLKKGKTYYVRVRAVARIGGKNYYGPWSAVKTVKTFKDGRWKSSGGYAYYTKPNGKPAKGLTVIGKKTYLFDGSGRQKTGWQYYKGAYRFFNPSNKAKGYMMSKCVVNGIKLRKDGTAVETGAAASELSIMYKAQKLVEYLTTPSQSKAKKLWIGFKWMRDECGEQGPSNLTPYNGWHRDLALHIYDQGAGSCFACGAAFAYYANAVGYKSCAAVMSGGHGWAEINGAVYDVEWERHTSFDLYAFPYSRSGQGGTPDYAAARLYVVQIAPNTSRW